MVALRSCDTVLVAEDRWQVVARVQRLPEADMVARRNASPGWFLECQVLLPPLEEEWADRRPGIRPAKSHAGRSVWLGAATFDDSVGVSHYTGQITHHTAPDIDAERELLIGDLARAKNVEATYLVSGVGPTLFGRNGGGDLFFTDGEIDFAKLASGCHTENESPSTLPPPARIAAKNAVFSWFANLWRRLY
jgi:hypothetical protein